MSLQDIHDWVFPIYEHAPVCAYCFESFPGSAALDHFRIRRTSCCYSGLQHVEYLCRKRPQETLVAHIARQIRTRWHVVDPSNLPTELQTMVDGCGCCVD